MVLGSRVKELERKIGLDRFLLFHRATGLVIAAAILLHPFMIIVSEQASGFPTPFGLTKTTGLVAFLAVSAAVSAPLIVRRLFSRYEAWVRVHRIGFLVLPLAFLHSFFFAANPSRQPFLSLWLLVALAYAALLSHRFITRYFSYRSPYNITKVFKEAPLITTFVMSGKPLLYNPGQFAFLKFPAAKASEWHPFTISSSPSSSELSITVKTVGDFTSELALLGEGETAFLYGPFGNFVLPTRADIPLVFFAGGIGITPFLSMLRWLAHKREKRRITLFWANRTREDLFFERELQYLQSRISGLRVVHALSRDPNWNGEKGHISEAIIRRNISEPERAFFLLCGPTGFMETLRDILKRMRIQKNQIAWERFSFI